jgi:hypothetical protein
MVRGYIEAQMMGNESGVAEKVTAIMTNVMTTRFWGCTTLAKSREAEKVTIGKGNKSTSGLRCLC